MITDSVNEKAIHFAPMLIVDNVAAAIEFYIRAFNAKELRRWSNEDTSVHVAEMTIGSALFHIHEPITRCSELSPVKLGGTTAVIGIFVNNPDEVMTQAVAAGAIETEAMQDFDYGYRQGTVTDPFGHHWTIEKVI